MILVNGESADQFFQRLLGEALEAQRVTVSAKVHIYLVKMLVRYIAADHDMCEPLAYRFLRALEQDARSFERFRLLQSVGDDALMLSGVFWQRIERVYRRPVDPAYHRSIGSQAYRRLHHDPHEFPYTEMADKFGGLVDALMYLGGAFSVRTDEDIMRLVELWNATHSHGAARALARYGIAPVHQGSHTPS
jgi:hypothetical protein